MVLILSYIWLSKGNIVGYHSVLISLCFAALPIPIGTLVFKYLLRYDLMVRPIALIILCIDIIFGPSIVYIFGMQNIAPVHYFARDGSAILRLY